jgi:2-dehydropantoate 2-reductase
MRIAILGTGALGCVFAAHLATRADVWMLGSWAEGIAAVQRDGIRITERDGSVRQVRVRATTEPNAVPPVDCALLLVKSFQTERAAGWAAQVLRPDGLAVTFQNGLDNGPKLIAAVGAGRAAVGVNYTGATLLGPGATQHTAQLTNIIGTSPATAERAVALAAVLSAAGLSTRVCGAIEGEVWVKGVVNAAINPLTALWRVPNGELLAAPERRALLADLVAEAAAVARARGVTLPLADPLAHTEKICRVSAVNHSSMLQDIEHGRPTEIDSINGVIVSEGRRLGVPVPLNEAVWRLVRAMCDTGMR